MLVYFFLVKIHKNQKVKGFKTFSYVFSFIFIRLSSLGHLGFLRRDVVKERKKEKERQRELSWKSHSHLFINFSLTMSLT